MSEPDYSKMNPGIVETVKFLRQHGFNTTDSGDGETRDWDCDLGLPYVHMKVDPDSIALEAQRLMAVLKTKGVEIVEPDEEGTSQNIQATYDPVTDLAYLSLYNVKLT